MGNFIRVDFGAMDTGVGQARARAQEIADTLSTATANVEQLRSSWQGSGSDSFDSLFQQWKSGVNQAVDALHKIAEGLKSANTGYQNADQGAVSTFGG